MLVENVRSSMNNVVTGNHCRTFAHMSFRRLTFSQVFLILNKRTN